ncbi:NAD(P)-dependent dehydrogenase (short-subunit alcohol dehydrogenase family) [Roseiarcus fermentans]|uniref:NAD(P)-dependent dehydrogenase (Short-subunit alcohol dehydrogenase family) n=1 Tax=Roseiarcus fermentans TaxID=1473586 RepID=A0A366FQI6_9HYPH|nr:SDR family NAD(P)-dependent oxidoreductase [Roseiarcus fermentans]RBP16912.1 NAD(P)-dependent dehydrogenase (short-subunit alcohol dehydrogenase family) [Roseiarcus fermentans]
MTSDLGLAGKRIIVTGAASGIGLETARLLASEGAVMVLMDRDQRALDAVADELRAVAHFCGDVTCEADCEHMGTVARTAIGGLDGLVHCAGVSDRVARAFDIDIDEWQRIVDVTLRGAFLACRAAARVMLEQKSGSIVALSSIRGLIGSPRRHAYGPAKAAVSMMTKNLACEWSLSGVRINAIAPGFIRTPMTDRLVEDGKIDEKILADRTPMGRMGLPIEVARASAFLLSDWSSYITGVTLPVDGGWVAYGGAGPVATH